MMVRRCNHKCQAACAGYTETYSFHLASLPWVWSLPPLFFITASCSASSSSHLTLSSFIPPCLTHLLFHFHFHLHASSPGPLTPVSSPLFLFHQHPCLSLSFWILCYFLILHLDSQSPPYQTGVVYPAAICKTSSLQVTPSGPGQAKERLRKQRGWESREGMRLKNIEASSLDTSIQISKRTSQVPKSTRTLSPKGHSIPAWSASHLTVWALRPKEGGRGKKPGTYKDCKAKVKKKKNRHSVKLNSQASLIRG